jgi:uncharacterized membrane protein
VRSPDPDASAATAGTGYAVSRGPNPASAEDVSKANKGKRLFALDALRGLIMVLMALDHANYMVAQGHSSGEYWGGPFPTYADAISFLTRLVTHLSAPGFFFLMGAGMVLFAESRRERGWTRGRITGHFLLRGAFLIFMQLLVVNPLWKLGPEPFPDLYLGVLYALGGTMLLGSLMLNLSPTLLLAVSTGLFLGTELTHPDPSQWGLIFDQPLGLLLGYSGGSGVLWVNYPILAWLELTVFGMLFGRWLSKNAGTAYGKGLRIGGVLLGLFLILRVLNGFGNIRPRLGDTWIDFLNVVKYPPSMTFTSLTMGVNLILLWAFHRWENRIRGALAPLVVFGRAPLFFYILHLALYLLLGRLFAPRGMSIPAMYPWWMLGLLILFPLTRIYQHYKHAQPANSLLRFL